MVIYANTRHNSAEEVQLTPMEGTCASQGFYGAEITLLHLRACGFPYKLAVRGLGRQLILRPPALGHRGLPIKCISSGSILDPVDQKPLDRALSTCILINVPPAPVVFMHAELDRHLDPGLCGQYHLHPGYAHKYPLHSPTVWVG